MPLADINKGFDLMHAGKSIRSVSWWFTEQGKRPASGDSEAGRVLLIFPPYGLLVCRRSVRFPSRPRLRAGLFQMDFLVDTIDPCERDEMMFTAGVRIILC